MAILNITADSFSGDGLAAGDGSLDAAALRDAITAAIAAGADLLDVGAESTRPGAAPVPEPVERLRVARAVQIAAEVTDLPIAVDTRRATTAAAALAAGAVMVNDTSGAHDVEMAELVAQTGAGWVLMHAPHSIGTQGWSRTSDGFPKDVELGLQRTAEDLRLRIAAAERAGVDRAQLAVDPGIGFGKSVAQNLAFLRPHPALASLGVPVYLGPSRKSALGAITGTPPKTDSARPPRPRPLRSLRGARFVRVHDVEAMRQAIDVAWAIASGDSRPAAARGRPWEISG